MSFSVPRLLGPPVVRHPPPPPPPAEPPRTGDSFMDLMEAGFNAAARRPWPPPPKGFTENRSATYLSTKNPCLNFFFQVVPTTPSATVTNLLSAAWQHDPLTALKLVCHLRGVRGTGKSDRERFYVSALWLHSHHPKTLALNVASFAEFGYMKDLLEILYRLIDGADTRQIAKNKRLKGSFRADRRWRFRSGLTKTAGKRKRIAAQLANLKITAETASNLRQHKRTELAVRAVERYARDPDYRFLHDRIAEFFAGLLASDLEQLNAGQLNKIGLAAKWCPSLDSSFDRATLLCESIARKLFPRDADPVYKEIAEEHYAYRVRDRLRKEVLVPIRKVLQLPELYMSAQQWDALPYNRVASVAMKNYKETFIKHDKERFAEYLENVKKGKAKIAAGALLPHNILASAAEGLHDDVAELQWRRMVSDLLEKGRLKNCIAVCDVSESMSGEPMDVCVALGLLISELSEEPWKGRVITFSRRPELHKITGESLVQKTEFIRCMEWGMNTDFQKVFDQILAVAVQGKLPVEKMVKRVFVFSDMEFDVASSNSWETDYEVICRKYQKEGYGSVLPEIVFWNLRDSSSIPVFEDQKGVALVSGFSKNLLKIFLDGDGIVNPVAIMEEAIAGAEYKKLVVFD